MIMGRKEDVIVGLDIGTTKICAIVGAYGEDGIEIIGIGAHPSRGLRKGVVINIESTVSSIRKAIEEAELMAGCEMHSVFTGIAGGHIKGFNSHGIVAVKEKEVKQSDIDRVIDAAKAVAIPLDREVIHILPQEFIIDDQDGIRDPLGMAGVRLESKVHIVTGAVSSAQNIIKCCNKTGLNVSDIVLQQLAASEAVLSADEKELGVALIDIGGGTSDLVIFTEGSIRHTAVISLGGNHITNDIALGLRTPTNEAERIKHQYGCAMVEMTKKDETFEVPSVGGRKSRTISRQILAEIIEPRVEEILSLIQREIAKSGFEDIIASGVVLTGGSTLLRGTTDLAERVFNLPVRRGIPENIGGLVDIVRNPIYSTGVGLVLYGSKYGRGNRFKIREENVYTKVRNRMKEWFADLF
jgi:cell division protein FtsA